MKYQKTPSNILKIWTYSYNWCHHTCIREILNKGLWELSRIALLNPYALWTLSIPSTYGNAYYPKSPWYSTCCSNTDKTLNCYTMNRYMTSIILNKHHYHYWYTWWKFTKTFISNSPMLPNQLMYGTLDQQSIIIDATILTLGGRLHQIQ